MVCKDCSSTGNVLAKIENIERLLEQVLEILKPEPKTVIMHDDRCDCGIETSIMAKAVRIDF
jgi:hypothetical protein